jgi:hypothetical protein
MIAAIINQFLPSRGMSCQAVFQESIIHIMIVSNGNAWGLSG